MYRFNLSYKHKTTKILIELQITKLTLRTSFAYSIAKGQRSFELLKCHFPRLNRHNSNRFSNNTNKLSFYVVNLLQLVYNCTFYYTFILLKCQTGKDSLFSYLLLQPQNQRISSVDLEENNDFNVVVCSRNSYGLDKYERTIKLTVSHLIVGGMCGLIYALCVQRSSIAICISNR